MIHQQQQFDVVVCGGGLAGFCAAVAAARHGATTCLIQDRPVFGGNSSSEIRVTPHGTAAFHAYARETGILSELLIEERARNHVQIMENGWTNSVWDMVMYDMAMRTPNLTCHLNTSVVDVIMAPGREGRSGDGDDEANVQLGYYHRPTRHPDGPGRIQAVVARVANAEVNLNIEGRYFIDCTGDGLVAHRAGCEWRMGTEGRAEFDEVHAPEHAGTDTMGNSIHIRAYDQHRPCPYTAPDWAMHYDDAAFFYEQGRKPYDIRGGFWWIEIGIPWHTITDAETIRHELTRHALGVWEYMKNKDERMKKLGIDTWALDWIGQVPGKRESRRILGRYFMTEHDIQQKTVFPDEIAYGGWFIDLHTPGGLLAPTSEPASAENYNATSEYQAKSYCGPYGIPLRILIAKDIDNLAMAGRNVSTTHAALGTVRVMATTALMGQAIGTACAVALEKDLDIGDVPERAITDVQQRLLDDGCFLPNYGNASEHDLARVANVTASSEAGYAGVGPYTPGHHEGLARWVDQDVDSDRTKLEFRRGQWLAIGIDRLDTLSVCLTNKTDQPQQVEAWIVPVEHIWDYRIDTGAVLAAAKLQVPPGKLQWIDWPVNLDGDADLKPGTYVRLDLGANEHIHWHMAMHTIVPGHVAAFQMAPNKMRRFADGQTMAVKVSPPQPCFGAANAINGVARPHRFTNLWRSDPSQPLGQWLQLEWDRPQRITTVQLTFPGHLLREYHACQPFYRDSQCARDYELQAWVDDAWQTVLQVEGNYHTRRRHVLDEPVQTMKLRVVIHATNGDPAAAVYEVRCYGA